MKIFAGIDVGSADTKAVLIDESSKVLGTGLCHSGTDFSLAAQTAFQQAFETAGASKDQVSGVAATGYGRANVEAATCTRTEIDCHARGAFHHFPRAITVVDIGGQDNKIISLDSNGKRLRFALNRKCAAGTGSFLEEMALRLRIPIEQLSGLASRSTDPSVSIGSFCTVFAMTEILGKIRGGVKVEDLARAALESVARRVLETQAISGDVVATGGVVAHNPILISILSRILGCEVFVPPHPQYAGALGAALFAASNP
jgi:(R)-2-hydroxyacyl-CoA dehydratese activating ATPase